MIDVVDVADRAARNRGHADGEARGRGRGRDRRASSSGWRATAALDALPQPADGVTYAAKIGRDDARLDWAQPAVALDRAVRAFDPVPGAYTSWLGQPVKVWAAEPMPRHRRRARRMRPSARRPDRRAWRGGRRRGRRLRRRPAARQTVQPAGGKRMAAAAFAAGRALTRRRAVRRLQ